MVKPYVHIGLTMGEKGMGYLTLFNHMPSGNQTWLGKIIFEWWILQQAALDYRSVPWVLDGFSMFVRWKWSSCGKKWLELQANLVVHPLHVFLDEISTPTAEIPDFVCKRHVHLRDFWDSNASPTNMIQNAGLTMYSGFPRIWGWN